LQLSFWLFCLHFLNQSSPACVGTRSLRLAEFEFKFSRHLPSTVLLIFQHIAQQLGF
jgi:hypothetical protein